MMNSPRSEEEKMIKGIRNLFRLERELNYTAIKDIRNPLILNKETKEIKYIILWDIKNLFEHEEDEEENYYKPVRAKNIWRSNYIEYKSNGDINKRLSVEEYLNKVRPNLKDLINNVKKSDTWKIQLTIANNVISSLGNDEGRVTDSKSNNIKIMISGEADEVIKELFDSLKNRYQNNLESMRDSEFVFGYLKKQNLKKQQ